MRFFTLKTRIIQVLVRQLSRAPLMAGFRRCQIAQQLAGVCVLRALRRGQIKTFRIALHALGFLSDPFDPEVFNQPDGASHVITCHMFTAQKRNHLAKTPAMQLDQSLPVAVFFSGHALKYFCSIRKLRAQLLGVVSIDLRIVLL